MKRVTIYNIVYSVDLANSIYETKYHFTSYADALFKVTDLNLNFNNIVFILNRFIKLKY